MLREEESKITCEATAGQVGKGDIKVGFAGEVLVGQLDQRLVIDSSCSGQHHARGLVVRAHVVLQVLASY